MSYKTQYLHTIGGEPALWDGEQIVYPAPRSAVRLVQSLREIKRHQQATLRFRRANKFDYDISQYRYVRVFYEATGE